MPNPRQPPPGLMPALNAASADFRNRADLATDRAASKNFRDWARAIDRHIADLEEDADAERYIQELRDNLKIGARRARGRFTL